MPSDPRGWCCWVGAIASRWNTGVALDPASFFGPGQESVIFLIDLLPGYGVFRWSKLNLYGGSKFPGLHSAWISLSHFMCKICDYKFPTVVLLSTWMDCLSCTAFWFALVFIILNRSDYILFTSRICKCFGEALETWEVAGFRGPSPPYFVGLNCRNFSYYFWIILCKREWNECLLSRMKHAFKLELFICN